MKKLVFFVICFVVILVDTRAYDAIVDGIYYNLNEDDMTAVVTNKSTGRPYEMEGIGSYSGSVEVPSSVEFNGRVYKVIAIGSYAFYKCESLTDVVIPGGVISIEGLAFDGCVSLSNVNFPQSVKYVGANAFSNTLWYNSLPDGCVYINDVLYVYKGEIPDGTHIDIKNTTTYISPWAFSGQIQLKSVTLPSDLEEIGVGAFYQCYNLITVGKMPEKVLSIGDECFSHCYNLEEVVLPGKLEKIGYWAFKGCQHLLKIVIPNSVKILGSGCFKDCGLISVVVGDGVEEIPNSAFAGCVYLTTVKLGKSVSKIGSYAFNGSMGSAPHISSFVIDAPTHPLLADNALSGLMEDCEIQVSCGCKEDYNAFSLPYRRYNLTENNYSLNLYTNYYVDDLFIERVALGNIKYHKMPNCDDNVATVEAFSYFGAYEFVEWSDGNKENPRTINLQKDTMLCAIFAEKGVSVEKVEGNQFNIYSKDNVLFVENNDLSFRVLNSDGKVVYSGREQQIILPRGVYLIHFENGYTYKILL
jgi:hypothetical protein